MSNLQIKPIRKEIPVGDLHAGDVVRFTAYDVVLERVGMFAATDDAKIILIELNPHTGNAWEWCEKISKYFHIIEVIRNSEITFTVE